MNSMAWLVYTIYEKYENNYNFVRVIQQDKNRQLLAADLLNWLSKLNNPKILQKDVLLLAPSLQYSIVMDIFLIILLYLVILCYLVD